MKYIYYLITLVCLFIFLVYIGYGGPLAILFYIEDGFYGEKIFTKHSIPYDNLYATWVNRLIGLIFWSCIFINIILLFFRKMNMKTKGKISLVCLIILLFIIFIPKIF
jgi:hypothetical protein